MEVVVTTGAIRRAKLQSNRHHQQTPSYFTGWMACLSPNKQCQALKENFTIKVPYIQMWTYICTSGDGGRMERIFCGDWRECDMKLCRDWVWK